MKNSKFVLPVFALLILVAVVPAFPQSQPANAHLSGALTDPSGASISGAKITAQPEASSGNALTAQSSADGTYSLSVPAGRYHVVVSQESFVTRESDLTFQPGETLTLNFRLELAPMSASVLVTGQIAPTTQEQSPAPSSILTNEQINQRQSITLPDLLYTQPGISFARTGPIGGLTTLFLDGGNSNYTKLFIDGTPANEPGGNFNYSSLALDNIDKVEVVHGAESALYGSDAMSGVIQLFSHRGSTEIPSFDLFSEAGGFS